MESEIIKKTDATVEVVAPVEELKPLLIANPESGVEVKETPSAENVVEQAFSQAVFSTVQKDEKVQTEIMQDAEEIIYNKASQIKSRTEMEAKEAYFNNKRSACECFGYSEASTEKWAVSLMGIWHNVITALWIVVGMLTFAPVTFVAKKLSSLIKTAWLAVLVSILIYVLVLLSPFFISLIATINGAV